MPANETLINKVLKIGVEEVNMTDFRVGDIIGFPR